MKVVAIVQARMGSTRLPGKVMREITNVPMIELLLNRLKLSQRLDQVVLATSKDPQNKQLSDHVRKLGFEVFQGSESDVLKRYYDAARLYQADIVVRITGDCPLIDPMLVDEMLEVYSKTSAGYLSNVFPPTYPDGLDIEVFPFAALEQSNQLAREAREREHVTIYIRESEKFVIENLSYKEDKSSERWTVDFPEDFEVISRVFEYFHPKIDFSWLEVLELRRQQPEIFVANQNLVRNEGADMGSGQKLWQRAKQVIPGGNMLLSKRVELHLPEQWPAYFSKAKGCKVWDLDNNKYTDMYIMGIGTNTLGYGHPEVDDAVRSVIDRGNMSTFNCPEEVYLSERLLELHPWADMTRLARSGGEANAIAIRIARAASGKDKVAICGYHGWHDWYLSANLGDKENLAGHLLPGLLPSGVPKDLKGSVLPFEYNDYEGLEELIRKHDVGVIKMEVSRNKGPEDGFLEKVRKLATDKNIVLIFDECTSGFRQTLGGLHKQYDVEPDMAIFGKALGNGYAITAIIGRRQIMEAAQSSFISSTFWTERIGPVAGLKTLEVMERERSYEYITAIGRTINKGWQELANKHELDINIYGLPALTGFSFNSSKMPAYKTFITQEMMSKGYLAGTSVYVCTEHNEEIVAGYLEALDPIFEMIRKSEDGLDINSLLKGPICHSGFKRLN